MTDDRAVEGGSGTADLVPKASAEMLEVSVPGIEPEQMLRKVLMILRSQIPFDLVNYGEYYHPSGASSGPTLVRSRFAVDGDEEFRWPARWIEVPPGLVTWAERGRRWISEIADFYAEHPEAEALRTHVVSREYQRRGITSFLIAPRMDAGRITAALTLGRRRDGKHSPFSQSDLAQLDSLRLEPVLRRVGEAFAMRTERISRDIVGLFTAQSEPIQLARTTVRKLSEGFGWEYVALFRVNRARGHFEVVAEYDAVGNLLLPPDYAQTIKEGMLGHVLRDRRELYAPNVRVKPAPFDYITSRDARASALCLPIRLGQEQDAEIEWILNLESSQLDAFPRPEQELLKTIVREFERSLQLWFEARLSAALLNLVEQGVVVLGEGTRIERANVAARRLLGLPKDMKLPSDGPFCDLESFAADRTTRELIIDGKASTAGAYLRLTGPDGIERRALAGASYRDETFHRRVWLLTDVEQTEWIGGLRYMETAVRTVAAQAHGSLALAGVLVRKVRAGLNSESSDYSLLDRVARNLAKADLPYERIAWIHDILVEPVRRNGVLNLATELRQFRDSLPKDDALAIKLQFDEDNVVVKGDPERLSFALRSLLGHLLAVRTPEAQVQISLVASHGEAEVNITLTCSDDLLVKAGISKTPEKRDASQRDEIAFAEARAFAIASHGIEAIRKIVEAHGGQLSQPYERAGEVHVTISSLRLAVSKNSEEAGAQVGGTERVPGVRS
jgi:PAS domain-containing protein